ncbi:MAG: nitrate- and nitrite sensing domain-containing protein [Acidimicrobiales bacterium]|nr:nitrate- and nitrite sensing domain-containing protein [Acidimicrobiales bacterium]
MRATGGLTRFVDDRPLRHKLLAIAIVPLVGLGWVSATDLLETNAERTAASAVTVTIDATRSVGQLVTALQRERDATTRHVADRDAADDLADARAATDEAVATMHDVDITALPTTLAEDLDALLGATAHVDDLRAQVTATTGGAAVAAGYTSAIDAGLTVVAGVPGLAEDTTVGSAATTYWALLQAQGELAGSGDGAHGYLQLARATGAPEVVSALDDAVAGDATGALDRVREMQGDLLATAAADVAHATTWRLYRYLGFTVAYVLGTLALALLTRRRVLVCTERTLDVLRRSADGDLTGRVGLRARDEVGQMGAAVDEMLDHVGTMLRHVQASAVTLASASEELSATSQQLGAGAEQTSTQATAVSAASEQVSANVQTVSAGAEQMGASIQEIASSASQAATVARTAVESADAATTTVGKLADSSQRIGEVVEVITSIAEQTNLLALNATIEAARAGEAGKGFAVVANEVKELARQTAKATEEVGDAVGGIQGDATAATEAIDRIGEVIGQINDLQSTIASAVEEQSATTAEITRSVSEAAAGTTEIAANVSGVAQAAEDTSAGATHTLAASRELAQLSETLSALLARFTLDHHRAPDPAATDPTGPAMAESGWAATAPAPA